MDAKNTWAAGRSRSKDHDDVMTENRPTTVQDQRGNLINANLVNHARFPEKKLYRINGGATSTRQAKAARRQTEEADGDAALPRAKPKRRANHPIDDDQEQEPLMDDQEGVAEGDF